MSDYYREARNLLKEQLESLKTQGLRVFICRDRDYCYGLISDGKDIVYTEKVIGPRFSLSYIYIPTKNFGDGVSYWQQYEGKMNLSLDDYKSCVEFGRSYAKANGIALYKNLEMYMKDKWRRDNYVEL